MASIFLQILLIFTCIYDWKTNMQPNHYMVFSKYRRCKSLRIITANDTIKAHGELYKYQPKLRQTILKMQNIYAWNNIEIRIQGIEYWIVENEMNITTDWNITLENLADYYATRFFNRVLRHSILLFTETADTLSEKNVVGFSYFVSECGTRAVGLILAQKWNRPDDWAITAAHEFGHIIGLDHVETTRECTCSFREGCIMQPFTFDWYETRYPPAFHSCSAIELIYHTNLCEEDCSKGESLADTCGSGVLIEKHNLECNCGLHEVCANRMLDKCCDAATCRLKPRSECTVEQCCEDCHFREGIMCRERKDLQCDITEYCVGRQPRCEEDTYVRNGQSCGHSGICYDGVCTDRDYLCQRMLDDIDAKYSVKCEIALLELVTRTDCYTRDINSLSNTDRFICLYTHSCLPIVCETKNKISTSVSDIQIIQLSTNTKYLCLFHDRIDFESMNGLPCGNHRICVNGICEPTAKHTVQCPRCAFGSICNNHGNCVPFL